MSNNNTINYPITNIGTQNPPKQFPFTIANGGQKIIDYSMNFLGILELSSASGVTIRFGDTGTPTDVVGAGVSYELPQPVNRCTIINKSGGSITGTVICAIGKVNDNRLSVSGSVSVIPVEANAWSGKVVTLSAATITTLQPTNVADMRETTIQNLSSDILYLGGSSVSPSNAYAVLLPNERITLPAYNGSGLSIKGYITAGGAVGMTWTYGS